MVTANFGNSMSSKHLQVATTDGSETATDQRSEWAAQVVVFGTRCHGIRMSVDSQTLASWKF